MESILRFYLLAMAKGRDAFVRDSRDHYLVKHASPVDPAEGGAGDDDDEVDTEIIGLRNTDVRELRATSQNEWAAATVRKRSNYPPFNRVVVGRSRVCDMVVGYASVSKVHAHFHLENFVPVAITDQRSANGTWVNARRLEPGATVPIEIGDRIRMATSTSNSSKPAASTICSAARCNQPAFANRLITSSDSVTCFSMFTCDEKM